MHTYFYIYNTHSARQSLVYFTYNWETRVSSSIHSCHVNLPLKFSLTTHILTQLLV